MTDNSNVKTQQSAEVRGYNAELQNIAYVLAKYKYETWRKTKENDGWKAGDQYDEQAKTDPLLKSYESLPEDQKESYQKLPSTVINFLEDLKKVGYSVSPLPSRKKILIIFSQDDNEKVRDLIRMLEAIRLETTYVQSIQTNQDLDNKLIESDVILVAISTNSVGDGTVNQQILRISQKKVQNVVPIIIDYDVKDVWNDRTKLIEHLNNRNRNDEAVNVNNEYHFDRLAHISAYNLVSPSSSRFEIKELLQKLEVRSTEIMSYGSLYFPLHIYVGGDGLTKYKEREDIEATVEDHMFELPPQIPPEFYDEYIQQKIEECERTGRQFHNGDQLRFKRATWGTAEDGIGKGSENKPLKISLEWTKYFLTTITNFAVYGKDGRGIFIPNTKKKIEDLLFTDIGDQGQESCYSDPFTTNLSVVTNDGYIFCKTRSKVCGNNPGDGPEPIQPAVSGSGAWKDVKIVGKTAQGKRIFQYNPFDTAIREAREEIIGDRISEERFKVVFFGLARISRTRFPFLFGELRCDYTKDDVMQLITECHWEGSPIPIKFTIDDVTNWIKMRYRINPSSQYATTYFSLIQSLIYEYPDKIEEINRKLTF